VPVGGCRRDDKVDMELAELDSQEPDKNVLAREKTSSMKQRRDSYDYKRTIQTLGGWSSKDSFMNEIQDLE